MGRRQGTQLPQLPKPIPVRQFNARANRLQLGRGRPRFSASRADRAQPRGPGVAGLYLHVPLCFHKCHYCDFYSVEHDAAAESDRQVRLVEALVAELHDVTEDLRLRPRTIFVGGGTPTILAADRWRDLLGAMARLRLFERVTEFTVEANPETVTADLARTLARGGVNRVSIGAQSFDPVHLRTLERWHDPANVGRAVDHFRAAGIDNINLDLIFAIPGQTLAQVEADLAAALALAPTHLSCYSLTYEPHTAMTRRLELGQVRRIDETLEHDMYAAVRQRLADAGFDQYEISAWSRGPTRRCAHNLTYWTCGNYIGVGPGAASHVNGQRWKIAPRLSDYLDTSPHSPVIERETLTPAQRATERLMMNLRLRDGVALDWFDSAAAADDALASRAARLMQMGMIERTADALRLTDAGLFVADAVIAELV